MKYLSNTIIVLVIIAFSNLYGQQSSNTLPSTGIKKGKIIKHQNFTSNYVDDRNVHVYLPNEYDPDSPDTYNVLYVHDGQNVFNPKTSYTKIEWAIDEVLDSLIAHNVIKKTVVVAIWNNTKKRFSEYMPKSPDHISETEDAKKGLKDFTGIDHLLSNQYLKFIIDELKPFIDKTYNVTAKKEGTAIMGSSMGGLISLYAICKYPEIFGAAGCLSTHWPVPILGPAYIESLKTELPNPKDHKIYFDYGTKTLDAQYEPYQKQVDEIMKNAGYNKGENWITKKFEGASHSEASWSKRVHIPLTFILQ